MYQWFRFGSTPWALLLPEEGSVLWEGKVLGLSALARPSSWPLLNLLFNGDLNPNVSVVPIWFEALLLPKARASAPLFMATC